MKAARILEYHKPLVLEDIAVPDIQADEVLVKVAACGICRSDVLLVDGFFQNYGDIPPPVIPGHEITGTIEKIGSAVPKAAGLVEGDHVVVAPGWGDGVCRHCQVGNADTAFGEPFERALLLDVRVPPGGIFLHGIKPPFSTMG